MKQQAISALLDEKNFRELLDRSDTNMKAALLSMSAPRASEFWSTIPSRSFAHLPPAQFQCAIRFRLRMVDDMEPICRFGNCRFSGLDRFGYHITSAHHKTTTHNNVRDTVAQFCREAKIGVLIEPAFASVNRDAPAGSHVRPADLFLASLDSSSSSNSGMCLDFAITSPLQPSFINNSKEIQGFAAEKYQESHKSGKKVYKDTCSANGFSYHPMVLETYGAFSSSSMAVLHQIATLHAAVTHLSFGESLHYLFARISFALMSQITIALLRCKTPRLLPYPPPSVIT